MNKLDDTRKTPLKNVTRNEFFWENEKHMCKRDVAYFYVMYAMVKPKQLELS